MATDILIEFDPLFQAPPTSSGAPTIEVLMKRIMRGGKILHYLRIMRSELLYQVL